MAHAARVLYAIRYLEVMEEMALRRERVFRDRENAFELHDTCFMELFRLPKDLAIGLIEELRPFLSPPSRAGSFSVETKVSCICY